MAVYKQVSERLLLPYHYIAASGMEANHDTNADALSVNERGNPETAIVTLEKRNDRVIYQSAADFDSLSEEEQASAFYAFDEYSVNRMERKGAIEKVSDTPTKSTNKSNNKSNNNDK